MSTALGASLSGLCPLLRYVKMVPQCGKAGDTEFGPQSQCFWVCSIQFNGPSEGSKSQLIALFLSSIIENKPIENLA